MAISINGAEQLDIHRQKMDPDISLMPHAKSNSMDQGPEGKI